MSRVVLTQPAPRGPRLAQRLAAQGHEPLAIPTQRLCRCAESPAHADFLATLSDWDWVIFVSPSAVSFALEPGEAPVAGDEASGRPSGRAPGDAVSAGQSRPNAVVTAWPVRTGLAAIGPGTAQALQDLGLSAPSVVVPPAPPFDAQALLACAPFDAPAGLRILVVHGADARRDWHERLRARGAHVEGRCFYRSEALDPDPSALARLARWSVDAEPVCFVFTTAVTVSRWTALLPPPLDDWARRQRALAVHPRIVQALRAAGWQDVHIVDPGEQPLLAGIESS